MVKKEFMYKYFYVISPQVDIHYNCLKHLHLHSDLFVHFPPYKIGVSFEISQPNMNRPILVSMYHDPVLSRFITIFNSFVFKFPIFYSQVMQELSLVSAGIVHFLLE